MTTLTDRIAAAETALLRLMTGSMVEELQDGNQRARYTPVDLEKLRGYIAELKAEDAGTSRRGAIGVQF